MKNNPYASMMRCIVYKKYFIPDKVLSVDFCSKDCFEKYNKIQLEELDKELDSNSKTNGEEEK